MRPAPGAGPTPTLRSSAGPGGSAGLRRHESAAGSVLVNLTAVSQVPAAEAQLAAMGLHEWFEPTIENGAAPQAGPINCTPAPASTTATGKVLADSTPSGSTPATGGPPVKLLLSTDGTGTVPAGDTGAGPWHLVGCDLYEGTFPGPGNTGNTGNTGAG